MQSDLESVIGNGARKLAQDLLGQKNSGVSVAYGYVSCVNDDGTIDVEVEDDEFASLPATTACMGAKPGDRCLVQTYAHQSTVTGILSLGDFPARFLDIDLVYPVGAIVQFWDARDPNELWPGTTWTEVTGVFLYARSTGRTVGNTGGEETHVLSTSEMPAHTHGASSGSAGGHSHMVGFDLDGQMGTTRCSPHLAGVSGAGRTVTSSSAGVHTHGISVNSTGDGQAHNNLPPYRVVSMWRRVA